MHGQIKVLDKKMKIIKKDMRSYIHPKDEVVIGLKWIDKIKFPNDLYCN